jgi:peptidylprolyl isomerase
VEKVTETDGVAQQSGLTADTKAMGIIKLKLFDDAVPATARIFRELAVGSNGYGYTETVFHRVVPNCIIQGGIIFYTDATGERVVYEKTFAGEWNYTSWGETLVK